MGKYTDRRKEVVVEKDQTKSPIWKGIGCMMMIVIPAISIAAASLTVANEWVRYRILPPDSLGFPPPPDFVSKLTYEMQSLILPIMGIYDLYAIIIVSLTYMVVLGSIISFVYALLFRMVGPATVNPFDAPRPNIKPKKYKR